jgi:hypothetical protein
MNLEDVAALLWPLALLIVVGYAIYELWRYAA